MAGARSEEHTSELQSPQNLVCRLLLEKKRKQSSAHRETPNSYVTYRAGASRSVARRTLRTRRRSLRSSSLPLLLIAFFFFLKKPGPPKFSPFSPPPPSPV